MKSIFLYTVVLAIGLACSMALAQNNPHRGIPQINDGSFNYQGYLEFEGVPANGVYYFEVHLLNSNGDEIDPRFDQPGPIVVTNGLFDMDIQMGGNPIDAKDFWKQHGHLAKKLRVMVGTVEGGPYTTLSPDIDLGSSPHALFSEFAGALRFPYIDTYLSESTDPVTMLSLTNAFGGTVLEANSGWNRTRPIISVNSDTLVEIDYGLQNGAVQINASDRLTGILSVADQYPVVGLIEADTGDQNAAILGQVGSFVPEAVVFQGLNLNSENHVFLGTPSYAGDFLGDVLVRDGLRVLGEPVRDYVAGNLSPIGPLAYGSVSAGGTITSGTGNLSASWDAANLRYIVGITDEFLTFSTHTVSITVVDSLEPRVATFTASGGDLLVKIWDLNSGYVAVPDNFSIVIYDANPVVLNQMNVPDGVDLDKYSEETGAALIETRPRMEPVEPVEAIEGYGKGVAGD